MTDSDAVRRSDDGLPRATWREWLAVALLPFGGLVVPLFGWMLGVWLLWQSRVWSVKEKLVGTLVVPGGLSLPAFVFTFDFYLGPSGRMTCSPSGSNVPATTVVVCSNATTGRDRLVQFLMVAAVVATLTVAGYLAMRLRGGVRRPASTEAAPRTAHS